MWQLKNPILVEAGPGRTLGALAMQHPDRRNAEDPVVVSSIRGHYEHQSDVEFLLRGIGRLWLSGAEIKWEQLHTAHRVRRVPLPTYPFQKDDYWLQPVHVSDTAPNAKLSVQKNLDASQWFYVPSWTRLLAKPIDIDGLTLSREKGQVWLVYADNCGFASALIARLTSAGHKVVTVRRRRRLSAAGPHAVL